MQDQTINSLSVARPAGAAEPHPESAKPHAPPKPEAIPAELRALPQWVAWRVEQRGGKATKVPINPHTGQRAQSNEPATWGSYDQALAAVEKYRLAGIGFVFAAGGDYSGTDLDKCRDPQTGAVEPWARAIVDRLASYTEISPSGCGIHIILRGALPLGGRRKGRIEMYDSGRYFTVTGQHLDGTPTTIEGRQAQLDALHADVYGKPEPDEPLLNGRPRAERKQQPPQQEHAPAVEPESADWLEAFAEEILPIARGAKNGARFSALYDRGDTSGNAGDDSGADLALCNLLAFYCAKNFARMDYLFRRSALMRSKWDEVHFSDGRTYGRATIERAIADTREVYQPFATAPPGAEPDLIWFPETDAGNAERFVALHGRSARWVPERKCFFVFDGRRWKPDPAGMAKNLAIDTARATLRQAGAIADKDHRGRMEKHARGMEKHRAISDLLALTPARGLTASLLDFDQPPYLLNVENGTIDLETGRLYPHKREDLLSRLAAVSYEPGAECPLFLDFLRRAMGDTEHAPPQQREVARERLRFLQKAAGLSLSGDVSEKVIFCLFGPTNAGKTTFLEELRDALGGNSVESYAGLVLVDSLISNAQRATDNNAKDDLAELFGKRFVTTSEAESKQRLAGRLLKFLTQGAHAPMKGHRKYEKGFTFIPTHKLWLDTNDLPHLDPGDDALWKRIKPVEFAYEMAREAIDPHFGDKLQAEGEGVLAWAVEGFRTWRREGLGDPPDVIAARHSNLSPTSGWRSGTPGRAMKSGPKAPAKRPS